MTIRTYLVGGYVRDEILGVKSKDIDYAVEAPTFEAMVEWMLAEGYEIFQARPEFNVARARRGREAADYVLCRKDGPYTDGRRPDFTEPGTIYDDLARRDFTINAIAKDEQGNYIDPWDGRADIERRVLRAVGDPHARLREDGLRVMRALRFSVTKDMRLDPDLAAALRNVSVLDGLAATSVERVREELQRMLAHDTGKSIATLMDFKPVLDIALGMGVWFKPTIELP